jgi:hypothetical protein
MSFDYRQDNETIEEMKDVLIKQFRSNANCYGSGASEATAVCAKAYAALVQTQLAFERRGP